MYMISSNFIIKKFYIFANSLFLIFLFSGNSFAQTCRDVSVELSAVVQNSPPKITLNWVVNSTTANCFIYRKLKTDKLWGNYITYIPDTIKQFIDSTVVSGISYEYQIIRTDSNSLGYIYGYGYINSGIQIPATEKRGKLIMLLDSSFMNSLSFEIQRLENDLEGDGWKVIRHNVSRIATVASVKVLIQNDYYLDTLTTKAVFLLGHVPVPYSGDIFPDGHPNHAGAWPADVYYADMNGIWTDVNVNNVTGDDPRNHNIPGDGKFDQSEIPTDAELQIGRVDFANMPAFPSSELQLLKNYLDKNHAYRHKLFTPVHRAVIDDNFNYFSGEAPAASGWKNFGPLVGNNNVIENDYFTTMTSNSYLWSYGCGPGSYTSAGGIGNTTDFVTSDLQGVFTMIWGSYFGDWDTQNNFLRAALAQGKTLCNAWSGRPHWQFHHMALGENIGYDVLISQNNDSLYYYNYGARFIHIALMGDPTLRNDVVAPVSNLMATVVGTNCNINWSASVDTVLGYNIYMKTDSMADYIRLNQNIITTTSYTDSCLVYPGTYTYMVSALLLQQSPSGTYYNLSQGISDTALNTNAAFNAGNVTATLDSISGNQIAELSLTGNNSVITRWQKSFNSGYWADIVSTSNPYTETPSSLGNWDYRAVVKKDGCAEANSTQATIVVLADSTTFTATSGDWHTVGNWNNGVPTILYNAIIPSNNSAIVNSTSEVCNNLTIASMGQLTVNASQDLLVNGNITLQSDATGTASLIDNGILLVNGEKNIQRFIAKDNSWHLLSAPVANQTIIGQFVPTSCDSTFDFYKWDESIPSNGSVWVNLRQNPTTYNPFFETNFIVGQGYLVAYSSNYGGSATHSFSGNLNNGDQLIAVTNTSNKYNLIGNPYPSAIDWDFAGYTNRDIRLKNANPSIWIWNSASGNYGTFTNGMGTNSITNIIAPHQGFFVEANTSGSFTIPNSARVHPTQNFIKTVQTNILRLKVTTNSNTFSDELIVHFSDTATANEDVSKWFSMLTEAPSLYSIKNNKNLTINTFPSITNNLIVQLGFKAGVNANYTFTSSGLNSFTNPTYIYLKDLTTNNLMDLNQNPNYTFIATTFENANRFQLIFSISPLSISDYRMQPIYIYAYNNFIFINGNPNILQIGICNILGQLIKTIDRSNGLLKINMDGHVNGYYIVKVITAENVYTKKVFLEK